MSDLSGWIRPRHAYILWESKVFDLRDRTWKTSLFTMNVEHKPDIGDKIAYYAEKGFKIVDYGNFPKTNDPITSRAARARYHSGPSGTNPWDHLEARIRSYWNQTADVSAKLAAAEERIKELEVARTGPASLEVKLEKSKSRAALNG